MRMLSSRKSVTRYLAALVVFVVLYGFYSFSTYPKHSAAVPGYAGLKPPAPDTKIDTPNAGAEGAGPNSKISDVYTLDDAHMAAKRKDHLNDLIENLFDKYRPAKFEPLNKYKDGKKALKKAFDDKLPIYNNEELSQFLEVSDEQLNILRRSHIDTVNALPAGPPDHIYHGTGVVFVSGGIYFPVMVATLQMLRRVSPTIPVEIFVADHSEYEPEMCEDVLPTLGAKCMILSDIYGQDFFDRYKIHGFQLKVFAILASSFDNVIFLDSDAVPIMDIGAVVTAEPFTSTGYIIWPDYWFRTTSPKFYDIAGITLGQRVRGDLSVTDPKLIPQADLDGALPDKSSESGQLVISKSMRYRSLLLSAYYNLHGYSAYYPLLSQGCDGEGDKETFIAAALVLGEHIHQIRQDTRPVGRFESEFIGAGMMQVDPREDYQKHVLKTLPEDATLKLMILHLNIFKLNLRYLFYEREPERFLGDKPKFTRFFGKPSDNVIQYDYQDIELYLWRYCKWEACELGVKRGIVFNDWKRHNVNMTDMCNVVTRHYDWILSTHTT